MDSEEFEGDSKNLFSELEIIEACREAGINIDTRGANGIPKVPETTPTPLESSIAQSPTNQLRSFESMENNLLNSSAAPACESPGNLVAGKKRNRRPQKQTWKCEIEKNKRMKGEIYQAFKPAANGEKKLSKVMRPAREMGPACTSKECKQRKSRHCELFTNEVRCQLFSHFWQDLDWSEKRIYVVNSVDHFQAKRKLVHGESTRLESFNYYLKLNGEKREVCQKMFLSTLGLGKKQVRNWTTKPKTQKPRPHKNFPTSGKRNSAVEFLSNLPKLPSHYCRKDTSKLYLEPQFTTKADLFRGYKSHCFDNHLESVSPATFDRILEDNNIGLYQPKKDRCDACCAHEAGNISNEEIEIHKIKYQSARDEKIADKISGINGNCHVLQMDVQAVMVAPVLNASSLYYKTKIVVHNFTVYDVVTRETTCYIWDETQGELVASVFATCLMSFLENYDDEKDIIVFSDGCGNQNRNAMMSSALLDHAIRKKRTVIQKYLEKGHTQMEVDSVHSSIECKLKRKIIHVPADYIKIVESARRNPSPYKVRYMNYSEFIDFSKSETQRYPSIRPGSKPGEPCVTDLRQIRYNMNGSIDYKLDHTSDWSPLPRKPKDACGNFPNLYSKHLPITKRKYQDLQDLLHVIPAEHHDFYKSLLVK